jgi:periplasmic protein TonB
MTNLKPVSPTQKDQEAVKVDYRSFNSKHLLLFILTSAIAHSLIFLVLARYEANKPVEKEKENKPIEFVVVPPVQNSQEPPSETNNRAIENSVGEINPEPIPAPEPVPMPAPEPVPMPTPEPVPIPTPEPIPAPKPAPNPEPVPAPEPIPNPEPVPAPEPMPAPDPQASVEDLISGSDAPVASSQSEKQESVATSLPPTTKPVPVPSNSGEGSAADLLGGDYQKTLADGGGAFFSPEALSYESVLNPQQLNALKDFDLEAYQREVYNKVKSYWRPEFHQNYTTWLTFTIQPNGQITELKIVESSGSPDFDRVAMEAVQKAAPLQPLPADFPLESLGFKYQFYLY